ncbi:cytochrome c biogenesis protein ResB [Puniceicoccales bacterium CK1056]|uniref:Cytochrome c biogenesis protein ResB n=1 Tax=Oceanipulchritudo coccoides TaxID=2706888 RepID=A0A6B2M2X8_9BACT|nr:cytochrome c biogenesis protein ResB [Oceanipulchritudo coccoides]NDV63103.1 cytochrome c biogenesis protein ResB [Oceanipulchritudo coccoides]
MSAMSFLRSLGRTLGSLRLTVYLLAFSVILVFFGTLDQVRIGIRGAQEIYFESLLAFWQYPESWPMGGFLSKIPLPVPGGYLIGPLLALNLVFSHIRHFRLRWNIAGISLIHAGVLMLLIGQLVTNLTQEESYMWLDEGDQANFLRSFHKDELYLSQNNPDGTLAVFSFPFEDLEAGQLIDPINFPVQISVKEVFRNAEIKSGETGQGMSPTGVNQGIGAQFNLFVKEIPSFNSSDQRDVRTAVVELLDDGQSLGTYLVSNVFEERFPGQTASVDGSNIEVGLRFKKTYLPFTITLLDFKHDRYPGTNIPMNFSSKVRVEHPGKGEDQEVTVFMNNPLRYEGLTFYQASFAKQDTASMFQVVRNPGRLLPYIACILVSIGLLYQFGWVAYRSIRRAA